MDLSEPLISTMMRFLINISVFGSFYDIPARAFYNVQVDLDYRRQWDRLVIKLETVDREQDTNSEVVHWITHYPVSSGAMIY